MSIQCGRHAAFNLKHISDTANAKDQETLKVSSKYLHRVQVTGKLLGAPGIATRSAPGLTTSNKKLLRLKHNGHRQGRHLSNPALAPSGTASQPRRRQLSKTALAPRMAHPLVTHVNLLRSLAGFCLFLARGAAHRSACMTLAT